MRAAAIVLVLAGLATGPAIAQSESFSGEWAYRQACAECHRSPERLVRRLSGDESEDRERLETFLAGHYAPDEAMRTTIIEYLLAL